MEQQIVRIVNVGKAIVRRKSDGKYLILVSSKWEERPDRSEKPDLPGGVVEAGESIEQGCAREIKEETGINISADDLTLIHGYSFVSDRDGAGINRLIYFAEIDESQEVSLSWEHMDSMWLSASEVLELEIREPYPDVFRHAHEIGALV